MRKNLTFLVNPTYSLWHLAVFLLMESSLQYTVSQVLVFSHSQPENVERSVVFFVLSYGFIWKFFPLYFYFFLLFPIIKFEFGNVCEREEADLTIISSGFLK